MNMKEQVILIAQKAKSASRELSIISSTDKNQFLQYAAEILIKEQKKIIQVNREDVKSAKGANLSTAMIDRLTLNEKRIKSMADGLMEIASLPDPVGEIVRMWRRPNGLQVGKMRVPIGVIGFIYESRPNVTIDAAGLCLKSGNAIILRGGSEVFKTNMVLAGILQTALKKNSIPVEAVQYIPMTDRLAVSELLKLDSYIDVIIPRGGESLIRTIVQQSTIPVIKHYKGVCSVYIDIDADPHMAESITLNAKIQRPGVCNAIENLIIHEKVAKSILIPLLNKLVAAGVEIRGDKKVCDLFPKAKIAAEEDWSTEYLDLILSVKIVKNLQEAMNFIATYGSAHSDSIITQNYQTANKFIREVDSSAVFVNASTRFNDGFEFGLGAEIGISTNKLHARGPMGLEELTTLKFIVFGDGQIRT